MAYVPDFVPKEHEPILRRWVLALFDNYRLNPESLADEIQNWIGEKKNQEKISEWKNKKSWRGAMWSRSTINRFVYPKKPTNHTSKDQMLGLWLYLSSDSRYVECFPHMPQAETQPVASFKSPDDLLAFALERFFCETKDISHEKKLMMPCLPGRYALYRLDLEPALYKDPSRNTVRVSLLEISTADIGLRIKETQDFRDPPSPHYQINSGVIFPYGRYLIAIMNSDQRASFKCMIIENLLPISDKYPVEEIKGKILVASHLGSAPSVKFFCRRSNGEEKYGIRNYEEIDNRILDFLKAPTLDPEKYFVVS